MRRHSLIPIATLAMMASAIAFSPSAALAEDNVWRIARLSGEAWVGGSGVQTAALTAEAVLKPGDTIRTGRNGRILLQRGAETILVSPNSAIGIPATTRAGMSTVLQQAGSILLDVEKANVPHFEVETPYLAAVVKGTRFRVTVSRGQARVDVVRGQVQVADFKSGQYALVLPGQAARVLPQQGPGLKLTGAGTLGAIQQGPAQASRLQPLAVPREGLRPAGIQPGASNGDTRAADPSGGRVARGADGRLRINAPLGEVRLDIQKATQGLARDGAAGAPAGGNGQRPTVWGGGSLAPGNGDVRASTGNSGASSSGGSGNGRSSGTAGVAGSATGGPIATPAAISGTGNSGTGNGNGNGGNGNNGNGNGNQDNGGNGNGNGNNGNGNGNGGGNGNSGNGNSGSNSGSGNSGNGNANGNSGQGNGRSRSGRS